MCADPEDINSSEPNRLHFSIRSYAEFKKVLHQEDLEPNTETRERPALRQVILLNISKEHNPGLIITSNYLAIRILEQCEDEVVTFKRYWKLNIKPSGKIELTEHKMKDVTEM